MKIIFIIDDELLKDEFEKVITNDPGVKIAGLRLLKNLLLRKAISAEFPQDEQKKK